MCWHGCFFGVLGVGSGGVSAVFGASCESAFGLFALVVWLFLFGVWLVLERGLGTFAGREARKRLKPGASH